MTQRWWLTNSTTPYTPATKRGGWEQSGATLIRLLGNRPGGTAATAAVATNSTGAANDVLWGRWVGPGAINSGTLAGTVRLVFGAVESNAATNAVYAVHIYVTTGDSDTPRGTVLSNSVGASEFGTTAAGIDTGNLSLTSLPGIVAGDRLVIELGYRSVSADTTARTATLNYGNTGTTDLAGAGTSVTTQPGWVDFSGADGIWSRKFETLVDTFSTGSTPGALWSTISGSPSVASGVMRLDANTYTGVVTAAGYQLRNSEIVFQFPATQTSTAAYGGMRIGKADENTFIGNYRLRGDDEITFELNQAGTQLNFTSINFTANPTLIWGKIKHTDTAIEWYTSPDGSTWTLQRTESTIPQWTRFSDLIGIFEAGGGGIASDYLTVDNVNNGVTMTTVTKDFDLRWAVQATVVKDFDLRWAISNTLTKDFDLRWAIMSTTVKDFDLRWAVLAGVTKDFDLRWAVLAAVTKDFDLRWAISNTLVKDFDLRWAISSVLTKDFDLRWAISNTLVKDFDLRWAVLATVVKDFDLRWAIGATTTTVTKDFDLRWAISNTVTKDFDLRWAVLATVVKDFDLRWAVLARVVKDFDLRWAIMARIVKDFDLRWSIYSRVIKDFDLRYAVLMTVLADFRLLWAVHEQIFQTFDLRWAIESSTAMTTVHKSFDLRWRILRDMASELVTGNDIIAGINEARAAHELAERKALHPLECPVHLWPLEQTEEGYHCLFGGHIVIPAIPD